MRDLTEHKPSSGYVPASNLPPKRDVSRTTADAISAHEDLSQHSLDIIDALNKLTTGVAIVSPDLRILSVNAALASSFGADSTNLPGRMFWELLPELSAAPEAEMILNTARDGVARGPGSSRRGSGNGRPLGRCGFHDVDPCRCTASRHRGADARTHQIREEPWHEGGWCSRDGFWWA